MKKIALLFVLFTGYAFSQQINDYQFVMVPKKFDIFKEDNKYNLNNSVKLLLQKYGFKAYLTSDDLPFEIANSNCNKLYADLISSNNIFTIKVKVVLKDCSNKILYETDYGKSNEKDLAIAYNQALRNVANSFESLHYKYNGKNGLVSGEKPYDEQAVVATSGNRAVQNNTDAFYFAQPNPTGYQVVNSEPRVIMRLFLTSQKDVFIATMGNTSGVLITRDGKWFFEFYEGSKLKSEQFNIRF